MTTEVLFTPTPSSSNGQVTLIRGKGGEKFGDGGEGICHRRRNDSMDDDETAVNCQRFAASSGKGRRSSGESTEKDSPKTIRSPRCEAFVMTGEKMLSLNPKISPCYAKMCHNQLPPTVEVESPPRQQPIANLFDSFPSSRRQAGDNGGQEILPIGDKSLEEVVAEAKEMIGDNRQQTTGDGEETTDRQKQTTRDKEGQGTTEKDMKREELKANDGKGERTEKDGKREEKETNDGPGERTANGLSSSFFNGSKSTPATPSKANGTATNDGEGETEDDRTKRSADRRERNRPRNGTINARVASSASVRNSDILTCTNSQQSVVYSAETIVRMARHLFTRRKTLKGTKVATVLVKRDELSMRIAFEFLALFNFAGLRVDVALRDFLERVHLCGDTFEREQLLERFAKRYCECNPTVFNSADDVQLLASALLLLSADLHGKVARSSSEKAMSCREFIDNLSHLEHNKFGTAMLRELYVAVSERPFNCQTESDETEGSLQSTSTDRKNERRFSHILSSKRRGSSTISELRSNSLAGIMVEPAQQVDYKHGWLLRKSIYDVDGKRTPFGRRKWLMHYATVRGMVLYLHPDEHSFSSVCRYVTFRNCILLHHALAEPCCDYTKRRNVFRLRTALLGESLFQTSESAEVQCWCDAINYVAAAFSTPALPTPVGANGLLSFYRPHLPSSATHLSISDQLRAHEQQMEETALNLTRLREKAPPIKAKGRVVHDYFYRERFLETEKNRYAVYVSILREKLSRSSSLLRCGDSFNSNAMFSSSKRCGHPTAKHSTFGEMSCGGIACSSVASQMDYELLDDNGTTATSTTTAVADDEEDRSNRPKSLRQHQNQLKRIRANT